LTLRWPRDGLALLIGCVFALGLASAYSLARDIGHPFGGFLVFRSALSRAWQLEASTPPWWPVIAQNLLRYDDQLVALNGQPFDRAAQEQFLEAALRGQTTFQLTLRRSGQSLTLDLPLRFFTFSDFANVKLPDLIIGLGFWLLAVAVYRSQPHAPLNRVFALGCALIAGTLWTTLESLFPENNFLAQGLRLSWIVIGAFVGVVFIHLATLFPVPFGFPPPRVLRGLYGLSALVGAAYALATLLRWLGYAWPSLDGVVEFGYRYGLGALGLGVVYFAARMAWLFTRPRSRRLQRQLALLLLSLIAAFPYVLITVVRALVEQSQSYFLGGLDLRYLILGAPIAFAFLILRYQTFQSAHPLLFWVLSLALSALLASVSAWLLRIGLGEASGADGVVFLLMFVGALITSAFWGAQEAWRTAFSRLFQWEQRSYAAVREVSQQVGAPMDGARLPRLIADALVYRLELTNAGVWLWREAERGFSLAGHAGQWRLPAPERIPAETPTRLLKPLRLNVDDVPVPAWLRPLRETRTLEVVAPLWASGELVGLLGLGKRADEEIFDERDVEIIELITQEAALFLLAALQFEQLRQVPHQVATAQERERLRLAQELHDTTQQFLGRLPFYLEVSLNALRSKPDEAETILRRLLAEVESAAQTLRQIRLNLAPAQLEHNLVQPLQTLIARFQQNTAVETDATVPPDLDDALSPEARHALYRVVQQALDNVAAHAEARRLTLALTHHNRRVEFTIADDGRGFSPEQAAEAGARGSFGMTSMRARITSLGGEFAVESEPGKGTRVSGWLPVS
jgi:signal transduction histidine kinase